MRVAKIWPDIRVCNTLLAKLHVRKLSHIAKKIWLSIHLRNFGRIRCP